MSVDVSGHKAVLTARKVVEDKGFFSSCPSVRRDVEIAERNPLLLAQPNLDRR